MSERETLRVTNLVKHYGSVHAVDGVSFSVAAQTVFTLLGPNGAGKTTTLEILEGIRRPDAGSIEAFGERRSRIDRAVKERMGVLLQDSQFEPYLKVREVIALFSSFFRRSLPLGEILDRVALREKESALVRTLSGGQRQRLAVGVALVNDPDLIFLDEPTTGLDPQARRTMWSLVSDLRRAGKTIILTTHYMEEAESLSDYVCIMDHGRIIAEGTPRGLASELGEETFIEFDGRGLSDAQLSALGSAGRVTGAGGELISLETTDLAGTMERLIAWSKRNDVALRDMTVRQPNLEDVFLSLTGRRLRD